MWQNAQEIICDDKDREYLRKIRKEYKSFIFELGIDALDLALKAMDVIFFLDFSVVAAIKVC